MVDYKAISYEEVTTIQMVRPQLEWCQRPCTRIWNLYIRKNVFLWTFTMRQYS